MVEALVMRLAIIKAVTLENSKYQMSFDNLLLIRKINRELQVKEIHGIVRDIHEISSAFVKTSFCHVHRKLNGEADALAKASLG